MPFRNPLALLGLLSIVPLIIIYLIRPRPKEIPFSSTIFLREGEAERSAVLSRLISDPLFWIQLLVLCSLSVAAAGPYTTEVGVASSHLVVVLDASASMEDSFTNAKDLIDPYLDNYEKISIVLAENIPIAALQEGSNAEARDTLARLKPKAVSADLSSAMILASNLLGPQGGNILVASDFISWTGDDPEATRKLLQADGKVSIVFADSRLGGENVALVEGWNVAGPGYVNHTVLVHNYGPARTVPVTISGPGGSSGQTADIPQDGDYYLSFTAYPGVNEISLGLQDAISWDNQAFVYVPVLGEKRVLYLGEPGSALSALRSLPNVRTETFGDYSGFDLVVAARNASQDGKLNRYIDGGGKVIFIASDQESPEYLPVRVTGEAKGPGSLWVRNQGFSEGLHFDEIGIFSYLEATPRRNSLTLVEANGVPVLTYWRLGKGTVIYNGLEADSDFYQRPEYPIFWYQMVNWITGAPDIEASNHKTGELIPLGETVTVETPSGTVTTANLLLDEVGIYRFRGEAVAANMYDARESSLSRSSDISVGQFQGGSRETLVENDLSNWAIALAALAILLELAIMRWRRET
ncbi:MAG: BatA domain-containing protein [Methanothrix sp.]|nr:BatA domain-containing protein [Methanothrix sp.]